MSDKESHRSRWHYFLVVAVLSIPFYVLSAVGGRFPIATFLPLSALMAFVPALAALLLVRRERRPNGAREFLARAFDHRRINGARWIVTALVLMPLVILVEYLVNRFFGAPPLGAPYPLGKILAFLVMFFLGAIGEELGWQGYAFAAQREKGSALHAALVIGMFWGLWHVVPHAFLGRSGAWIFWQSLGNVALRVIIVWLFVNAGQSVFIAVLFHTLVNMVWGVFPNYGAAYDPFVMLAILAAVAAIVVVFWGPSTLARFIPWRPRSS